MVICTKFGNSARDEVGGPGYGCAERFDGQKRGCADNIFYVRWLVQTQNAGNQEGVWCRLSHDAARHFRTVRTAGFSGFGTPKKRNSGAQKLVTQGGFMFFFCFFSLLPAAGGEGGRRG